MFLRRAPWQAHREHRPLARLACHGHVAAHHACELAGDGEAETGAAAALRGRKIAINARTSLPVMCCRNYSASWTTPVFYLPANASR
jgi:hypothetical protein